MSWGQCYSGSNNIHFDFPPIMMDGRNFSSWQPEAVINNNIQQSESITSNWEYRKYMQSNGLNIMKYNSLSASSELGVTPHSTTNTTSSLNVPFLYKNNFDTRAPSYGYSNSDLKTPYLSSQQLNSRMISPSININEYINQEKNT
jgi:hypothetical protein